MVGRADSAASRRDNPDQWVSGGHEKFETPMRSATRVHIKRNPWREAQALYWRSPLAAHRRRSLSLESKVRALEANIDALMKEVWNHGC